VSLRLERVIFLVDGSGSMEPAWDAAWRKLFEYVHTNPVGSYVLLAFKWQDLPGVSQELANHVVARYGNAVVLSVSRYLAEKAAKTGQFYIRRTPTPDEVGLAFRGKTPLNDAIIAVLDLLDRFDTYVPCRIVVVSDNRDNWSQARMRDVMMTKRRCRWLKSLEWLPVGDVLLRYLDIYDNATEAVNQIAMRRGYTRADMLFI